jgi:hypothetical protein
MKNVWDLDEDEDDDGDEDVDERKCLCVRNCVVWRPEFVTIKK